MAPLFLNTCDDFISSILERVAQDYSLDANELKKKYFKVPVAKKKRGTVKKKIVPVHNHPLCVKIQEGCPLCQLHGNVMDLSEINYEIIVWNPGK
jgi:hypothetical protein